MTRALVILGAVAATLGLGAVAESQIGAQTYRLDGASYAVPHKYDFVRSFNIPWLSLKGWNEPADSVWLQFPAREVAEALPGYRATFHGYATEADADIVVNVLAGHEAREFAGRRGDALTRVAAELAKGSPVKADASTGWRRVLWLVGQRGTPGEGGALFYLVPPEGEDHLPANWLPPSCQSDPDINGHETYSCSFTISDHGRTYDFQLRQENLAFAKSIPTYVSSRMGEWRQPS